MKKKETIIIDATGGNNWIGGLYYKRNIIFSLLQNVRITSRYKIVVMTERENANVFYDFGEKIIIKMISAKKKRLRQLCLLFTIVTNGGRIIFPSNDRIYSLLKKDEIHWIADFQHNRIPSFFAREECVRKNNRYKRLVNDSCPLVLSSESAYLDMLEFYRPSKKNIYVIPFVSYIEPIIRMLEENEKSEILKKYCLNGKKYAVIMNQFWQHKNHIVVLEAIKKYYLCNQNSEFLFAFTGKLDDYRSPEYIDRIKKMFTENEIIDHCLLLGFVDRTEQIEIMKNAEYIIQPSLFEGWGTVVEDAKVLNKTILLSDIPVHREQMNDKCILFDPHDSVELAKIIEAENKKEHIDDVEAGIADMYKRAKEYSKEFEQLLNDLERK